jgi:hypothetical protein
LYICLYQFLCANVMPPSEFHWGKEGPIERNAWWMAVTRKALRVSNWSTLIQPHDFNWTPWNSLNLLASDGAFQE